MNRLITENTNGFTEAELDEINAAKEALFDAFVDEEAEYADLDEKHLDAKLTNAWGPTCNTAAALIAAIRS